MKWKNSHRTTLSLLVVGLVVVSAATLSGAALSGTSQSAKNTTTDGNWSTDRADNGRTGATTGTGPSGPYADTDWKLDPDGRMSDAVVEGDTVYVASTTYLEYNQQNGKVAAYDADTGEVRWNRTDLSGTDGSPTIANGTLYVSSDAVTDTDYVRNESGTPGLYALDPKTGDTKWRSNASEVWGHPVVVGDTVYVIGVDDVYGKNDTLLAIDANTGQTEQSYRLDLGDSDRNVSSFVTEYTVVDDTAYLSVRTSTETGVEDGVTQRSHSGTLMALNLSDGSEKWTTETDSYPVGMSVSNGNVYWTTQPNEVYALAADNGTQRWHTTLNNTVDNSNPDMITAPAVSNGTVYVGTDNESVGGHEGKSVGTVEALDADDGSSQWRFETAGQVMSSPAVTNDTVYVGGSYTSEYDAEEYIDNISNGFAPAYSRDVVYALNRNDGSERWGYAFNQSAMNVDVGATIPANDHLYVLIVDQYVYPQSAPHQLSALNASDEQPTNTTNWRTTR